MVQLKQAYVCSDCGSQVSKWQGQCPECHAWNSLTECVVSKKENRNTKNASYAGTSGSEVLVLSDVNLEDIPRFPSTFSELDRVLGGGIVPGSVILLGGSPGIGK